MPQNTHTPWLTLERFLVAAALVAVLGVATSQVHSFDIFWQLQSGKYLAETQRFIHTDIFSLASDAPRFEHCWLHDLICYGSYLVAGYAGISLLKGLLIWATALLLVATARVRGSSWLAILILLPPAMLVTRGAWLERPQLWTFLFFSLYLLVLEIFRHRGGRVALWLLPAMLLWVNLHAGAILAVALVAAYLVGETGEWLARRSPLAGKDFRWLALVTIGLFAATLATPYGSMLLQTLVGAPNLGAAAGNEDAPFTALYNMDWRATTFASEPFFFYALMTTAGLLLLGWRRLRLTDLCLLGGLMLMGLKLGRHTTFFLFATCALLPLYADAAVQSWLPRVRGAFMPLLHWLALVAAVGSAVYFIYPAYRSTGFFNLGLRGWHYPIAAAEFVKTQRLPANLYNTYDWGGYLMWTLYPDYLVFWDGRQDSPAMFRDGWQVMAGKGDWQQILDRHQVRTIVTRTCTMDTGQRFPLLDRLRASPAWTLVFADDTSLVFVRGDAIAESWLQQYRLPEARIDDTILATAKLLTEVDPWRYLGWWEQARIHLARRQYREAFATLEQYLSRSPVPDPVAENYYRMLYPQMQQP